MSYLLAVHWIWCILAFLLGGCVGWSTFRHGDDRSFGRWMDWAAVFFFVGLTVTLLAPLPGRAGFWLETALLLFAIYIVGCLSGWHLRILMTATEAEAKMRLAPAAAASGGRAPAFSSQVRLVRALVGRRTTPAPWTKPPGLTSPRDGADDDLRSILGVGPKTEAGLHALGVFHFDQIAAWTPAEAAYVGHYLGFPGRVEQKHWIEQARLRAAETSGTGTPHAKKRRTKRTAKS